MTGKELRIVYMGTPDFAVAPLRALVEGGYNVVAVITMPDKPAGRGLKMQESAVKQYAVGAGLSVLQPEKLKDPGFVEQFKGLKADLGIVIAFRMLPEVIWSQPRLGTFNLHASLLPQYRGAAPINRAIIDGEKVTGVTTFMLNSEIDKGDIIGRREVVIDYEDTAGTLHDKLMEAGTLLVVETVDRIASGKAEAIAQPVSDESLKPAPKIFKEDCLIRWNRPTEEVRNFIRGLSPYPAAWAYLTPKGGYDVVKAEDVEGETHRADWMPPGPAPSEAVSVKIFSAETERSAHPGVAGSISVDGSLLKVACGDGFIVIDELQMAGKKRMKAGEFLRGFKNITDYTF